MSRLSNLWVHITSVLFPILEEALEPLSEKQQQFVTVCELAQLENHMGAYRGHRLGRSKLPRVDLAKAFVAKAVYDMPTTKALRERLRTDRNLRLLCGWEGAHAVPSAATFSRAFGEFAHTELGSRVHQAMVRSYGEEKIVGHISRDATAILARERPAPKAPEAPKPKHPRGRPRKNEVREEKEPRRVEVQPARALADNIADLPKACDWGGKKNSKGKTEYWLGYKLHVDCADGGIPISALLTSASVHDSQVAIPLAQMSAERVTSLYDLMDAAYDVSEIKDFSRSLGHVPIIDNNPRKNSEKIEMDPATARRYDERTTVERFNAALKDNHGGRHIRVRGHPKVTLHLMMGVIAITALQMIRIVG